MNSRNQVNKERLKKIVKGSLDKFNLDLTGHVVFTEAASMEYAYTPILAGLANAKMVYAFARDSSYGTKEEIKKNIVEIANEYGLGNRISVIYEKNKKIIGECDIITNSGFVRPIDREMIDAMKESAVISLMFEAWEYRNGDLDLDYCREKQIPVLGTNEGTDGANLFNCLGFLISKILFEVGLEVHKNRILIIGGNKISKEIKLFFAKNRISHTMVTFKEAEHEPMHQVVYFENFKNEVNSEEYDAVIFCENLNHTLLLGETGLINRSNIRQFANAAFIHISGNVDEKFIRNNKIDVYPGKIAPFGHMSLTGDYLGPLIPIELNAAGLKVGEIMANLRREGNNYNEVIMKASKNPLVSSFSTNEKVNEKNSSVSNPELFEELRKLHFELRDYTKRKYNRINPFNEDLFSWEEKGAFWGNNKKIVMYDSTTVSGDVTIGDNTWIGPFCDLDGGGKLTIGEYCCLSAGVQILTHDTAKWSLSGGREQYEYSPVEIGSHCFIGAGAIIIRGIKIGNHCLIGAGSVVTKDIPQNSIVVGVPAVIIGNVVIENDKVRYEYFK